MKVSSTSLAGCVIIEPRVFGDERGFFLETFQARRYAEQVGIDLPFVQDNHSRSTYGVLRGLHFQRTRPQGKLVHVIRGEVFDVAVDLRKGSATFGKWEGVHLSENNKYQLWIPPGFAHGFLTLSDVAELEYKCTDYYCPEDEGTICWDDPELAIAWPETSAMILSEKDARAPAFGEIKARL